MTIPKDLKSEVDMRINEALDRDGRFRTPELITSIVASWSTPSGPDEEKWRHCAFVALQKIVADATRRFSASEEDDQDTRQCSFPGYEKIRRAYQVDGETVAAEKLTIAQAMKVLDELRRVQRGIEQHVNEMLRFIDEVLIPRGNGN